MNLKDIAKLAGVSTATVSNVLNGNTSKVSAVTKERIEKIIKEVDYKPNAMARSLAKKESRMIGLVVPYIGPDEDFFMNPYYARMVAALERYVRSKEYYLMLRCVPDCRQVIPQLSSWNVDGVFFLGVVESDVKEIISALDAPVVFLDTYTKEKGIVNVGLDDYKGGYLSARYLIGKGHRKIALACPDYKGPGVVRERYLGFMKACEEANIEFTEDEYIVETCFDFGKVDVGFKEDTKPTMECKSFDTLKENDTFTNYTKTVGVYFGVTAEANSKWTTITHIPEEKHEVKLPRTGK